MRYGSYPSCYTDPSVTDAEHLTHAAYHLIEAGYSDEAQPLIDRVVKAFEHVPVDKKRKEACKALGEARYFPHGIITVPGPNGALAIPAPAYETDTLADMRKSASKRASLSCRRSRLSWFSSRQADAAAKRRLPGPSPFRPAAILERVAALCRGWSPDMPPEAAAVIADKLAGVLEKNPVGTGRNGSTLRQDLWTHGTGYYSDRNENTWGFRYLPESQVKIAGGILSDDNGDQVKALNKLDQDIVTWDVYPGTEVREAREAVEHVDESTYASADVPFIKIYRDACRANRQAYWKFTASAEYQLKERVVSALDAARDVCNLICCHEALRRHPDEYLHDTLKACKMIDDSLEVPDGLPLAAMSVMAARALSLPSEYACNSECVRAAYDAVGQLSGMFGIPEAISRALPGPADGT